MATMPRALREGRNSDLNLILQPRCCRAILPCGRIIGRKTMASASRTAANDRIAEIRARFGPASEPLAAEEARAGVLGRCTQAIAQGLTTFGFGARKKRHRIEQLVEKYREEDELPEAAPSVVASYPFPSVKVIAEKMREEKEARRFAARKTRRQQPELPSASLFSDQRQTRPQSTVVQTPAPSRSFAPPRRGYPAQSSTSAAGGPARDNRFFGDGFVMFSSLWSPSRPKS